MRAFYVKRCLLKSYSAAWVCGIVTSVRLFTNCKKKAATATINEKRKEQKVIPETAAQKKNKYNKYKNLNDISF